MQKNASLLAIVAVRTAENEPSEVGDALALVPPRTPGHCRREVGPRTDRRRAHAPRRSGRGGQIDAATAEIALVAP